MAADWWAQALGAKLSQGDILESVALGVLASPTVFLRHATGKGGADGWAVSPSPIVRVSRVNFLASGAMSAAIALSHDCEIDKEQSRVIVAPLKPISSVAAEQQDLILQQRSWAHVALPDVPSLGTCFADLRSTTALDRASVSSAKRLASMSPAAVRLLQARLVGFFTRLALPPPNGNT